MYMHTSLYGCVTVHVATMQVLKGVHWTWSNKLITMTLTDGYWCFLATRGVRFRLTNQNRFQGNQARYTAPPVGNRPPLRHTYGIWRPPHQPSNATVATTPACDSSSTVPQQYDRCEFGTTCICIDNHFGFIKLLLHFTCELVKHKQRHPDVKVCI